MRRLAIHVLPLMLVALAIGGCGAASLSAAQLRTRASRICARAAARLDRIPVPRTPEQGGRFLRAGLAAMRPTTRALQRLTPPADLRESYDQAVSLNARALALVVRSQRAVARGEDPIAAFRRLQLALAPVTRIEDSTWRGLEIPACTTD